MSEPGATEVNADVATALGLVRVVDEWPALAAAAGAVASTRGQVGDKPAKRKGTVGTVSTDSSGGTGCQSKRTRPN